MPPEWRRRVAGAVFAVDVRIYDRGKLAQRAR